MTNCIGANNHRIGTDTLCLPRDVVEHLGGGGCESDEVVAAVFNWPEDTRHRLEVGDGGFEQCMRHQGHIAANQDHAIVAVSEERLGDVVHFSRRRVPLLRSFPPAQCLI